MLESTLAAFERATYWSSFWHGYHDRAVGLAFGHGVTAQGTGQRFVQLTPLGNYAASADDFDRVRQVQRGGLSRDDLDPGQRMIHRMGELSRARSLRHVDFFGCGLGAGEEGRTFLRAVANVFGCRVRGLPGDVRIQAVHGAFAEYDLWVEPAGSECPPMTERRRGRRRTGPFCVPFRNAIPSDTIWVTADPD